MALLEDPCLSAQAARARDFRDFLSAIRRRSHPWSRRVPGESNGERRGSPLLTPGFCWLRGLDLNQRPLGYEHGSLLSLTPYHCKRRRGVTSRVSVPRRATGCLILPRVLQSDAQSGERLSTPCGVL